MTTPRAIRVLVVEDHVLFRKAVVQLLCSEPDLALAGEAGNGREALELARALQPDVILMDLGLPEMDGLEATRRITAACPAARIVILTASAEDATLFAAIRSGARGYLLKEVDAETLFRTVGAVARGEAYLPGPLAAKVLVEWTRPAARIPGEGGPMVSPREEAVLVHVALGRSNKEIGAALGVAENTVRNHLKHILAKLHLANRVQAATYAVEKGMTPGFPSTNG